MPQNMDPNIVLLYECIQSVGGTKKIDFKQVGKALGVNTATARMRYWRFEAKMKSGGIVRSRVSGGARLTMKTAEPKSKPRKGPATTTRKKRPTSESGSVVSSGEGEVVSESEVDFKPTEGPATRTRGVKIDLKDAYDNESDSENDTENSADEYDANVQNNSNSDDDEAVSDIEPTPRARNAVKDNIKTPPFRRSGSPPLTPRRFGRSQPTSPTSHFSTSSSQGSKIPKTANAGATASLSYDEQIKRDISNLNVGMMLPVNNPSNPPAASQAIIDGGNGQYVKKSDIFESIERDDGAELADPEAMDAKMEEEDIKKEDQQHELVPQKSTMPPLAVPATKKTKRGPPGCATQ